jgi:hypothetical protein
LFLKGIGGLAIPNYSWFLYQANSKKRIGDLNEFNRQRKDGKEMEEVPGKNGLHG